MRLMVTLFTGLLLSSISCHDESTTSKTVTSDTEPANKSFACESLNTAGDCTGQTALTTIKKGSRIYVTTSLTTTTLAKATVMHDSWSIAKEKFGEGKQKFTSTNPVDYTIDPGKTVIKTYELTLPNDADVKNGDNLLIISDGIVKWTAGTDPTTVGGVINVKYVEP